MGRARRSARRGGRARGRARSRRRASRAAAGPWTSFRQGENALRRGRPARAPRWRAEPPRGEAAGASRRGVARDRSRPALTEDRDARARSRCALCSSSPAVAGSWPSTVNSPAVTGAEPEEQRDERRLAGAVRAEQAGDPGTDVRVEAGERDRLSVALDDAARRDDLGVAHPVEATCPARPARILDTRQLGNEDWRRRQPVGRR